LEIADRNANAAAQGVAVAQETARHELRAYVGVKKIHLELPVRSTVHPNILLKKGGEFLYVTLKNYGKTPAVVAYAADAQFGGEQPRPKSLPKPGGAPQIVQPGRSISRSFPVTQIEGENRLFFVILRIFYTDIYGVGYGHRLDYATKKPGQFALQCTYEKETVHPPALKDGETDK